MEIKHKNWGQRKFCVRYVGALSFENQYRVIDSYKRLIFKPRRIKDWKKAVPFHEPKTGRHMLSGNIIK